MIYVPDLENYKCFVLQDKDTIRAYENVPLDNSLVNYRDYYVNSHYVYNDSVESIIVAPKCIDISKLTNEVYYRNDFDSILVIFLILVLICFYFPTRLIFLLFKKRGNI